jgi:beta-lactamase class A
LVSGVPSCPHGAIADEAALITSALSTGKGNRMPRLLLACVLSLITLVPPGLTPAHAASPIEAQLVEKVRSFKGIMGVAAKNLATGETIVVNGDTPFPTASSIKTAVMVEVFHQIAEGKFQSDTMLALKDSIKVGGAGMLPGMHDGMQLTVSDLLWLMITASDNTATNMLVNLVGAKQVDERMAGYGLTHTRIYRPTFRGGHADVFPEEERDFGLGMTTPSEMARLMEMIADGRIISRAVCDEMLRILRGQIYDSMIPRSLPHSTDKIRVANKTGSDEEKHPDAKGVFRHVRSDAAYIESPKARYVIAIYTRQVEDTRWGVDNDALTSGAAVSRMIYDHFNRH